MIRPFLAVRIRQAGHATVSHSDVEVHPFNMRGADHLFGRVAASVDLVDAYYRGRGITPRSVLLVALAVFLHDLGKVHVRIEDMRDTQRIGPEAVRADLVAAWGGGAEVFKEFDRIVRASLPKVPVNDQLGFPFDGDEAVGIPFVLGMTETLAGLFLASDETPQFIAFDVLHLDPGNGFVQEPLAVLPDRDDEIAQGVPVNAGHPFGCPDRHPLQEEFQGHHRTSHVQPHVPKGFGLRADKGLGASLAAVSLMALAVFPVFLRDVLAVVADHDSPSHLRRIC